MSHYEECCKATCRWCAEGIPMLRGRIHARYPDGFAVIVGDCTALSTDVWAEQQFEHLQSVEQRAEKAEALVKELRERVAALEQKEANANP